MINLPSSPVIVRDVSNGIGVFDFRGSGSKRQVVRRKISGNRIIDISSISQVDIRYGPHVIAF